MEWVFFKTVETLALNIEEAMELLGDKNPNAKKLCERYGKPYTMHGLTSTAIKYARDKGFLPPA